MELRKTESRVIEGIEYQVTQLGAIKARQVFVRVLKVLGPAMLAKKEDDMSRLFDGLHSEDIDALCEAFGPLTVVPGVGELTPGPFDIHFAGRMKAMFQWLLFCLEVNFKDFLSGKGAGLLGAVAGAVQAESASNSPKAATGTSGAS